MDKGKALICTKKLYIFCATNNRDGAIPLSVRFQTEKDYLEKSAPNGELSIPTLPAFSDSWQHIQVYSVGTWPIGIFVCRIWVMTTASYATGQDVALEVFTAVVYGILVAGVST